VRKIFSTLAVIWRLASPYFRSEDKWAGRILLAAVIAIELSIVGINVLLNSWNNTFYNALQDKNWDAFVYQLGMASDPLAPLADADLSRQMARRIQSLQDAIARRRG
jgi:ABC-type uncharacterized transport system fused permease/ATPase subunit